MLLFGDTVMATIQTIEDWMEECDRLLIRYVQDMAKMRTQLSRIFEESKRENLWTDRSNND